MGFKTDPAAALGFGKTVMEEAISKDIIPVGRDFSVAHVPVNELIKTVSIFEIMPIRMFESKYIPTRLLYGTEQSRGESEWNSDLQCSLELRN